MGHDHREAQIPRADGALGRAAWATGLATGGAGLTLPLLGAPDIGALLFSLGLLVTAGLALVRNGVFERVAAWGPGIVGVALVTTNIAMASPLLDLDPRRSVIFTALGGQLLLLAITAGAGRTARGWGRNGVPVLGHVLLLWGSLRVLLSGFGSPVLLLYISGMSLLAIEAFWSRRDGPHGQGDGVAAWEGVLLTLVAGVVTLGASLAILDAGGWLLDARGGLPGLQLLRAVLLAGVALAAGPPAIVDALRVDPGSPRETATHGLTFVAMLVTLILAVVLAAPALLVPIYGALIVWLTLAVLFEYAALAHHLRSGDPEDEEPDPPHRPRLTVVVAAMNEAQTLARSVTANLAVDYPLNFLLVPAEASTDPTVEVARRLAADHPRRVRVIEGTGGSKARDLNLAWEAVDTDLVLILDADETVDEEALLWGVSRLAEDPSIGIVQGRKRAREANARFLDTFMSVERRFSTLFDQRLQADVFDAAHFAGSGALVRREVPRSVGWWSPETLTEDIEFTLRLYLDTTWQIAYEPRMLIHEQPPGDLAALVRQRGRWARGWAQVYALHFPRLLREAPAVGGGRTFGLLWQLTTAVSAPWSIFLPALLILSFTGLVPGLPGLVGLALAVLILPSRALTYTVPYLTDPHRREPLTLPRLAAVVLSAYLWVPFGWVLQLHALYLELSRAPSRWHATRSAPAPG